MAVVNSRRTYLPATAGWDVNPPIAQPSSCAGLLPHAYPITSARVLLSRKGQGKQLAVVSIWPPMAGACNPVALAFAITDGIRLLVRLGKGFPPVMCQRTLKEAPWQQRLRGQRQSRGGSIQGEHACAYVEFTKKLPSCVVREIAPGVMSSSLGSKSRKTWRLGKRQTPSALAIPTA